MGITHWVDSRPKIKLHLHIIICSMILLIFILGIARLADKGTPKVRSNIWTVTVCIKSTVFLTYQLLTEYHHKFKRWASLKAYMILNIIDTIFWFVLFVLVCMSTSKACFTSSSCALGGIIAVLAIILFGFSGFLTFIITREWRHVKTYGSLPGTLPK